ncbi:Hypothetical_protein [Hexamita inflata]|uniref:Hypothetical_protein n=1 Tax=Hexamita inflata TaxID=28002 RepID=A0AA86PWK5_9EUKA|nr:Hypothetical protein HINF_LOCUS33102 [Hexamita inflata]
MSEQDLKQETSEINQNELVSEPPKTITENINVEEQNTFAQSQPPSNQLETNQDNLHSDVLLAPPLPLAPPMPMNFIETIDYPQMNQIQVPAILETYKEPQQTLLTPIIQNSYQTQNYTVVIESDKSQSKQPTQVINKTTKTGCMGFCLCFTCFFTQIFSMLKFLMTGLGKAIFYTTKGVGYVIYYIFYGLWSVIKCSCKLCCGCTACDD